MISREYKTKCTEGTWLDVLGLGFVLLIILEVFFLLSMIGGDVESFKAAHAPAYNSREK